MEWGKWLTRDWVIKLFTKEVGKMIFLMEKEDKYLEWEIAIMKVHLKKVKRMEKEYTIGI